MSGPPTDRIALVVEDDPDVRSIAATIVRGLGFETIEAGDGASALAIIDGGQHVDLLFTDVVMPGKLSGIGLAKESSSRLPGLKVILTTGYSSEIIERDAESDFQLLRKPYRAKDIAAVIDQLMGGS